MRLFQFILPTRDNSGKSLARIHAKFEDLLLAHAGGFTYMGPTRGVWRDDNGKVYRDDGVAYNVAMNEITRAFIVAHTMTLFSDQRALFVAEIGTAIIHEREPSAEDRIAHD